MNSFFRIEKFILNSLPNDKMLDPSKFKAFADDKLNVNQKSQFLFLGVGNIVERRENAAYQYFLLFPKFFQKASFSVSLKVALLGTKILQKY